MTSDGLIGRLAPGSRVLVIRLRALGDCVLTTPALHLLKQYRPDLSVGVVCDPALRELFERNPDVDQILDPAVRAVRGFRPALCVNFHGGTRSARLCLLSGAAHRAGYDMLRFQGIYNIHIPTAQRILAEDRPVHTAEHMASAMFYLGVPPAEVPRASLYPPPGRSASASAAPYAVFHPAASRIDKMWPLERFRSLAESLPFEPVFIGGPADDLSSFSPWRAVTGASLGEVGRLIRDASLFVGNDSGPAHMAAALGTPAVVLFGPSSVETWRPWKARAEALRAQGSMNSISVEAVAEAASRVRA